MSEIPVRVEPTAYTVSVLPTDCIEFDSYAISVEWRADGQWAIMRGRACLGHDGMWDFEPQPSSRGDEWLALHRFDLDAALNLAKQVAPDVRRNGRTAREVHEILKAEA